MNAGIEPKPDDPKNQTPPKLEPGLSLHSPVDAGEADLSRHSEAEADSASGATQGLPPDQPLPPGAEMLRRATGSSLDSFSDEGSDLSLLTAEQFQRRYAHFEVEIGPDGKPVELGRGAMGITYKASDTTLRRQVALKVISSRLLHNESLKNRFLREARAAASLRHPYVASIYYLGSTEASYFYAMELIEGQTLDTYITQHGPLDAKLALEITIQITSALAAAHQAGLVHRDIKPANIILTRDSHGQITAKVIDFGLVKLTTGDVEDSSASEPGIFLGTPRYASPEQISCGAVDIRSDLYSVGVTLWQMLTKSAPFIGTPSEVAAQHLQAPLPISKLKYFPQPLVALLTHVLEKDPKDRPQTPDDLLAILRATQRNLTAPKSLTPRVPVRPARFHVGKAGYVIGAALIVAAALASYFYFYRGAPAPEVTGRSVAILPFDNVGGDKQNDYLSDGLTTEVIFEVSKMANLRVISRDSVLQYKAEPGTPRKPLQEIGQQLNVQTVLESSVERIDQRIKVIAVLYEATSGKRLWGAAYNREMKDLFAIQTDVAKSLAAALKVRLSSTELTEIDKKPTDNVNAYDLYLQAEELFQLYHKEDNEKAIALFRQVIELDPKFALGYVGLAGAYMQKVDRFGGETYLLDSAIDLSRQAVDLDQHEPRAYTALALAYQYRGMNEEAHKMASQALSLAPNSVSPIRIAAVEADALGHVSEAYALRWRAHQLEPNDPWEAYSMAKICAWVGETELMLKWMDAAISLETDPDRRAILECEKLIFQGDWSKAASQLKRLPQDLKAYDHAVFELSVACSAKLGDWTTVDQIAKTKLGNISDLWDGKMWGLAYLALAAQAQNDKEEMNSQSEELVKSIEEKYLGRKIEGWEAFYLAVGERLLGDKDQAYSHLENVFSPAFRHVPLMGNDPLLSVFREDPKYKELATKMQPEMEKTRMRIHDLEKATD
jgi:serine/threonine protein kinase/tetratricopeptide (TPR) repeat protein